MIKDKKIIITGSNGFIGSQLFSYLRSNNEVIGIDKIGSDHTDFYNFNLTDNEKLESVIKDFKPSYFFHMGTNSAGHYKDDFLKSYSEDSCALINVINSLKSHTNSKLVFMSSSYVYSGSSRDKPVTEESVIFPVHNFGIGKHFFERLICRNYDNSLIFRLSNVFGRGTQKNKTALNQWLSESKDNNLIKVWGKGKRKLQYIEIRDLIEILTRVDDLEGGVYNLGSDTYKSMYDVASLICNFSSSKLEIMSDKNEGETLPLMSINKLKTKINFEYRKFEDSLIDAYKLYNTGEE